MSTTNDELEPLRGLLDSILTRIDTIESKVGIDSSSIKTEASSSTKKVPEEVEATPAVKAYDEYIKACVKPFCNACDELKGLKDISKPIYTVFNDNIGHIIQIASLTRKPVQAIGNISDVLKPYLKPVQESITTIQKDYNRLDRVYDYHYKSISEMLCIFSWVVVTTPPPGTFVRETIGSCDYWCNKIRKQYKSDDGNKAHIVFCDTMKVMLTDLVKYIKEYHLSGLSFNPKGACTTLEDADAKVKSMSSSTKDVSSGGGDDVGIQNELLSKISGDSAATGLKKVTRDQQTWRKEYKKPNDNNITATTTTPKPITKTTTTTTKQQPKPKMEFISHKQKWIIEHQTSESNNTLKIDITNPKQQVYIYKCSNITITIQNKFNTIVFDSCTKCNLIFDTAISSCEVVNCKNVQIQTLGLCPSFTIDKTDSCLIYLSEETKTLSTFVTSKSSEMNVSYPDTNGEMKEVPIPEQYLHKFDGSGLSTRVSDLYH